MSPENETENAWLRSKNRVKVRLGSSTFAIAHDSTAARVDMEEIQRPAPTPEEAAAGGGADGGARSPMPPREFDIDAAIREASGIRKMRKAGL